MKPSLEPMARPAIMVPSMTACGIVQEEDVVLAGAGLGLVSVDEDVFGLFGLLGDEGPLESGGEAGAAAAAHAGGFHGVDDPLGTFGDGLPDGLVAVELDVLFNVRCAQAEAAGEDFYFIGMGYECGHYFSSFPWPSRYIWKRTSTFSFVRSSWKS